MRTQRAPSGFLAIAAAAVMPFAAAGQRTPPLELHRLEGPIVLDGRLDEPAWAALPLLPLTMYAPTFRGAPAQRTEVRVGYDDEYLYAAGWFYDDDPAGIRINSLYRDRWNGDDAFALYIDAFNDDRNAKWFGTTPAGMRFDQLVSDDGATLNGSWDAFWTSRTTVTDEGWFAEVRIPFSTLGFQPDAHGTVLMGLTLTRLVSRTGERVTFPAIDPAHEFRKPSVAQDVVLRDVRTRRPLYVTPYVLGGVDRVVVPGAFETRRGTTGEVGLDVRYPLSGALTLDLTVNTDFAQVEADDQQVNLDRFPLFYPERRRFFQEGSGIFDWTTGGDGRLFHSRRIGLSPADLTPVPVLGGARLVGRAGAWDLGLLGIRTGEAGAHPAETFGVLRLRRGVLNAGSTMGMIATTYAGGGRQALSVGGDGLLRVGSDQYIGLKAAATFDEARAGAVDLADRALVDVSWARRTGRGLQFDARLTRAGPDYRPELGFNPRTDFSRATLVGNWFFFTDGHPLLRRVYPGALAFATWRNETGVLESGTYAFWVQWDTRAGGGGWLEPKWFREDVLVPFTIGGTATIPAGTYDFADFQLVLYQNAGARLRTRLDARAGSYFDGTRVQLIAGPTWNASRHLELGGEYQVSILRFPDRDEKADVHVTRVRVGTALDAALSGNALIQFNSTTDRLDFNVRLRYAFAEGTDLWLVYNEGLDTARGSDFAGVDGPLSRTRALILKYSHTFGL